MKSATEVIRHVALNPSSGLFKLFKLFWQSFPLETKKHNKPPATATYTVKMNTLYLINKIVATDYKQYYELN